MDGSWGSIQLSPPHFQVFSLEPAQNLAPYFKAAESIAGLGLAQNQGFGGDFRV